MTILNHMDFWAALRPGDRLMAVDVGQKTLGLATSLVASDTVLPAKTLARTQFTRDAVALQTVMNDLQVRGLVIGWPLLPSGQPGQRCQSVKDFTAELDRFLGGIVPITFQDERFSTAAGDQKLDHIGQLVGKSVTQARRDRMIDALAAQQILEEFLR